MDRRKSTGKGLPKPKPKPLPKPLPKPARPYPMLPPAPVAPSGQSLSHPLPFLHVMLPLPATAPPAVRAPPQLAKVPLPAALAPPPMPPPSSSSPSTSGASLASPSPASTLESIYNSPLSFSGTPPPCIPPPLNITRIPFPRSHLPVHALFGPGRKLERVGRWAVMPNSGGLRLYWADAQLDSAQLSEPCWLPGAVDPGLMPESDQQPQAQPDQQPQTQPDQQPQTKLHRQLLAQPQAQPDQQLQAGEECSETVSVNVLNPSPVESVDLGEESSGSYLLCFSCSFLLLVSASLSTFCNSLAWQ